MVPKQRLDKLIPLAIQVLEEESTEIKNGNVISKTYHGYVSSFGAMMAISSPLAAALMFENSANGKERNTKEDKSAVVNAVLKVMKADDGSLAHRSEAASLSAYLMPFGANISRRHKQDLAAACIALKLAMRSYPKGE